MKKIQSVLLSCSMVFFSSLAVLAAEPAKPAPATTTPQATAPAHAAQPAAPAPSAAAHQRGIAKIGYVDLMKVGAESAEGKAANAEIKNRSEKLRTKIEAREKQLAKQKGVLEQQYEKLSPKDRATKAKEFQKKVEDFQKLLKSSNEEMEVVQEKTTNQLYQKIKDVAVQYGITHGFDVIVAKKDLLYLSGMSESHELTDEVIAELNKRKGK